MAEAQYKNPRYWMGGDRGLITENDFVKEAEKRNYEVIKSSKRDDMYKHIDFYLKKNGKSFSVDVKARKKTSRSDKSFDDEYTWVEFKNVAGGAGGCMVKQTTLSLKERRNLSSLIEKNF